jgi:hypothetical protein
MVQISCEEEEPLNLKKPGYPIQTSRKEYLKNGRLGVMKGYKIIGRE